MLLFLLALKSNYYLLIIMQEAFKNSGAIYIQKWQSQTTFPL
jgi:hypothetical protein